MSSAHWLPAYIGVGSNLSDPVAQVHGALERLGRIEQTRLIAHSRLYRSRPWGEIDQPDFINAVAGVLTQLTSSQLLRALLDLEAAAGRPAARKKWSARVLDLDLLIFGSERSDAPERQLPHARLKERNFVLFPLREIAPTLDIAGVDTVAQAASRLSTQGIEVLQ